MNKKRAKALVVLTSIFLTIGLVALPYGALFASSVADFAVFNIGNSTAKAGATN
ncbi:MAG: hypothetical protein HY984_00090 [Candidatus Magasanikbacteria bacterium]|nr:hypothetical protein [Candidatus Magasanikbacteria bacterium]